MLPTSLVPPLMTKRSLHGKKTTKPVKTRRTGMMKVVMTRMMMMAVPVGWTLTPQRKRNLQRQQAKDGGNNGGSRRKSQLSANVRGPEKAELPSTKSRPGSKSCLREIPTASLAPEARGAARQPAMEAVVGAEVMGVRSQSRRSGER